MRDIWIAGIARGHNAGICLLKNGEIVFAIEEERFTREKYDGTPFASMVKILEYTDKLDYLVISHTQPDHTQTDFTGEKVYHSLARKLGLIAEEDKEEKILELHDFHHMNHASAAFYRSGFETATALIVDGAGTFFPMKDSNKKDTFVNEVESIYKCEYPAKFTKHYSRLMGNGPFQTETFSGDDECDYVVMPGPGLVKCYEAVTEFCGWDSIEAGKTMGLFPYGKPNDKLPPLFNHHDEQLYPTPNQDLIISHYPSGGTVQRNNWRILQDEGEVTDLSKLDSRRDMAYKVQTETQQEVLDLIRKAVEETGNNNIVLSGGYALNCVANYWYLNELKDEDINLYVEPISNDAGTAMGAALWGWHKYYEDTNVRDFAESLYLGPTYEYSRDDIDAAVDKYDGEVIPGSDAEDAVKLILDGNIVTLFQGGCENGPRALGNRSILYDPRTLDGKDYVNSVKHREYFRPFAGSILHEYADEWFDMRGLEESPHMMYAMNCTSEEYAKQIPAIIHVDQTCRIQTVKEHQNPVFYEMIQVFFEHTGVPILFNTSFNLGGEPLVETLDDAVRTLSNSDIEYLYLPENGVIIKVENEGND